MVLLVFTLGLMAGGTVSAMTVWALSGLTRWVPAWAAAATVLTFGAAVLGHELKLIRLKLPANHRQVPQEVYTSGPYWSNLQFGFELGTGVRTYLPSTTPHLLALALLLLHVPLTIAIIAGASFGMGRAAMTWSRTTSPDPAKWETTLNKRMRIMQPASALTALAVLATLL